MFGLVSREIFTLLTSPLAGHRGPAPAGGHPAGVLLAPLSSHGFKQHICLVELAAGGQVAQDDIRRIEQVGPEVSVLGRTQEDAPS